MLQGFPDHEAVDGAGGGRDGFHDVDVRVGHCGGELRLGAGGWSGQGGQVVEGNAVRRAGLHGGGFDGGEGGKVGWDGGGKVIGCADL